MIEKKKNLKIKKMKFFNKKNKKKLLIIKKNKHKMLFSTKIINILIKFN